MCAAWSPVVWEAGLGGGGRRALLAVGTKAGRVWLWRLALPSRYSVDSPEHQGDAFALVSCTGGSVCVLLADRVPALVGAIPRERPRAELICYMLTSRGECGYNDQASGTRELRKCGGWWIGKSNTACLDEHGDV
jgi:hypothetical protein